MTDAAYFAYNTVMVTGASGFIGGAVVEALFAQNPMTRIVAVGRDPGRTAKRFALHQDRVRSVAWNMADPLVYPDNVNTVIHVAGKGDPASHATVPANTMRDTILGCVNALDFARVRRVAKFIFVSSGEIYGDVSGVDPIREDEQGPVLPLSPRSCYPISKLACESLCLAYGRQYGIPVCIARLCHIYGPGINKNDPRIAAFFFREAAAGRDIVLKSPGAQCRSLCHINDAANAVLTITARGEPGQAYNVAAKGSELTVRDFAERIAGAAGVRVVLDIQKTEKESMFNPMTRAIFATEKLQALGWSPQIGIMEGIQETLTYFKTTATRETDAT